MKLRESIGFDDNEEEDDDIYTFQIPTWAVGYLAYGEGDDLDDEELAMVKEFDKNYEVLEFGDEQYFDSRPAFGLASDVIDCKCRARS